MVRRVACGWGPTLAPAERDREREREKEELEVKREGNLVRQLRTGCHFDIQKVKKRFIQITNDIFLRKLVTFLRN